MNDTLIQIISEETMPNLLAAMALKPQKVIHLCTPLMRRASRALHLAYKQSSLSLDFSEVNLSSHPGLGEMNQIVRDVIKENSNPILNFTGGTKLMSIGAYAAASMAKIASVYVDTATGEFVNGLSGGDFMSLFPQGSQINSVSRQLTVNGIAVANGVERVSTGKKWTEYVELADLLLRDLAVECKCHNWADQLVKKEPRDYSQCQKYFKELYGKLISLPDGVADAAVRSGLFEYCDGGVCFAQSWVKKLLSLDFENRKYPSYVIFEAINAARWPISFFHGNWWEVAVMRYLDESGRFRDLRWSVNAGSRGSDSTDMEEDILGVEGVNLLYVSCKRGGDKSKLSRVIEDVNSSARRIGGRFAKKILAVFFELKGQQGSRLQNRCGSLGIDLLDRETVATIQPWTE